MPLRNHIVLTSLTAQFFEVKSKNYLKILKNSQLVGKITAQPYACAIVKRTKPTGGVEG